MREVVRAVALAAGGLLAGCATPPPAPVVEVPAPVAAEPVQERIVSQPLKHLVGRNLKAMPDKALDVRASCRFKDVAGGRGSLDLQVAHAEVRRFLAEISIPRQGVCRFDMKHFRQTEKLPNVVLTDTESGCTVRMWEQEIGKIKGVTVAFNNCQAKCEGDAFSYLWPILVDPRNGRCV